MSHVPRTYSALTAEEQAAVSVWIDAFDQSYEYEGAAALKLAVKATPEELRPALVSQLLPALIDHDRKRQGRTPTLHELRSRFPDLAGDLTEAYPLLPEGYRLPVELRGYRVLRVVGEGGQALVLRAQDDVHSAVAIKLSSSPEHNEWLLRERELLGQCQHPGIPEVIASGVEEDRAYFVMPFLRGTTLADKYTTHRPTEEEAARIAAELCDIVEHLHSCGILHRDIKPQNVWLDDSGGVKLIDLGMAIDRSSWGSPRATVGEFHGTPAFMSPEQAASDGENDGESSDVFSIGATLYWMLTGSAPFAADNPEASLGLAASATINRKKLLKQKAYSTSLKRNCLRAIAIAPSERFPSAEKLGKSLRATRPRAVRLTALAVMGLLIAIASALLLNWPSTEEAPLPSDTTAEANDTESVVTPPPIPAPSEANDLVSEHAKSQDKASEADTAPPHSVAQDKAKKTQPKVKLNRSQFQVSLSCAHCYHEPYGNRPDNPAEHGVLLVRTNPERHNLQGRLEYRIDKLPWRELETGGTKGMFLAFLGENEASQHGAIELRLVNATGQPASIASETLTYHINVARMIKNDTKRFLEKLFKNAATAKCMEVTDNGWAVHEEYSHKYTPVVKDMWYSDDQRAQMKSVAAQVGALLGPKEQGSGKRPTYTLRQAFALVSREVRSSPNLWVKLEFRDGATCGPTLYTRDAAVDPGRVQRVKAWFEWLGPEDEVATFRGDQLTLTGVGKILPDLTHLHVVGEYFGPAPPTEKVDRSGKAGSKKATVSLPNRTRRSSELTFEVANLSGKKTFDLPPVWNSVAIRGRMPGGELTPSFTVKNSGVSCGCALHPVESFPKSTLLETYLYIVHDEPPVEELSIIKHIQDSSKLSKATAEKCLRSRLELMAMLPVGGARVDYFADKEFKQPLHAPRPGVLYARYVDSGGNMVGYSAYHITQALFQEWIDHAVGHVASPAEFKKHSQ